MSESEEWKCPYCPKTVNMEGRDPENGKHALDFRLGRHVTESHDHPDISYVEAKKRVIAHNEGKDKDNEGSIEEVEIEETPDPESGSQMGSSKSVGDCVTCQAPVLVTDGGEEGEDEPELDNDETEIPEGHCPRCRVQMTKVKESVIIEGADGNTYESDGSELRCPSCGVVKDGDKWL